ncbi:TPA: hypothetical protein G9C53_005008 [Salmonella enterica subsp. enterica serovar Typhimurium var. 5-]|uniref:Uncharacterized protein n=1 Tax=Salmonella enterica subsp. enterica serovar Typhimurium var. 5- TaxID=1620419 RepID=A0A740PVB4_SALTM|nr:hypothetical protein [Salmonella enterica subsp. enterica serovar Typhimurium var. 5-]
MSQVKCIYSFDEEEQYLKIDFLSKDESKAWKAFVFDENWTEFVSPACSISNPMADVLVYAYENLGLRGRIAVLCGLDSTDKAASAVETSLFHLQALLYSSAILVLEGWGFFEDFGFKKAVMSNGNTLFFLASEDLGQESCRFL